MQSFVLQKLRGFSGGPRLALRSENAFTKLENNGRGGVKPPLQTPIHEFCAGNKQKAAEFEEHKLCATPLFRNCSIGAHRPALNLQYRFYSSEALPS